MKLFLSVNSKRATLAPLIIPVLRSGASYRTRRRRESPSLPIPSCLTHRRIRHNSYTIWRERGGEKKEWASEMQANPMHFMLMGAHRGKGTQSISDLCVPVVRRLESKRKGRAAVTCHTTTMFAFFYGDAKQTGVLIRHARQVALVSA